MRIPDPDPGELWTDINTQLFGSPNAAIPGSVPGMNGFVKNYLTQKGAPVAKNIMHYFNTKQVPVISALAKQFAVCDRWFASAPSQTWPNRWFVHTATADGHENNEPIHVLDVDTIYNRCELAGTVDWKIYFHDFAQSMTLLKLWPLTDHFHLYSQFQADCQTASLPSYSFIEPRYYDEFGNQENDMHPPSVVTLGEQLIADVYNCIRASKLWPKTMLIITFDEHGGCYDHVPPPTATVPEAPRPRPSVQFRSVRRARPDSDRVTLCAEGNDPQAHGRGSVRSHINHRYAAKTISGAWRFANRPRCCCSGSQECTCAYRARPIQDRPVSKRCRTRQRRRWRQWRRRKPLNGMQTALVKFAANLPESPGKDLQTQVASVKAGLKDPPPSATADVHAASTYVKKQVGNFYPSHLEQERLTEIWHHFFRSYPLAEPRDAPRAERHRRSAPAAAMATLSYGDVVRWPPAVAHGGTGLSRPLSLSLGGAARRAPRRTPPAVGAGRAELRGPLFAGRRLLLTAVLAQSSSSPAPLGASAGRGSGHWRT